jgi:hypothetical protein
MDELDQAGAVMSSPLRVIQDERGRLLSLEEGADVPFTIRRVYFLLGGRPDAPRGFHAHRALEQLIVCVHGSCRVILDDGRERREVRLSDPSRGLFVGAMVWRELHDLSPETVVAVLASAVHDESDYIRDYEVFRKEVAP